MDNWVVVHIDHAGPGRYFPRDFMDVTRAGDAGANVDDLADSRLADKKADDALQERPVGAGDVTPFGSGAQDLAGSLPIYGIVVLSAQVEVVHAGRVRPAGVNLGR